MNTFVRKTNERRAGASLGTRPVYLPTLPERVHLAVGKLMRKCQYPSIPSIPLYTPIRGIPRTKDQRIVKARVTVLEILVVI